MAKIQIWAILCVLFILGILFFYNRDNSSEKMTNIPPETQFIEQKKSIEKASDLALSLSDLPSGWEISTRGELTLSDMNEYELNLGWKEGYNIVFKKLVGAQDIEVSHFTEIYPAESISFTLDESKETLKAFRESINGAKIKYRLDGNDYRYKFEELSNPNIGDDSIAYKAIYLDYSNVIYYIEFRKSNYREILFGSDYELIKDLAKKAEDKI